MLPYLRMHQVPDGLMVYVSALADAGYSSFEDSRLRRKVMEAASRLESGESVEIRLANIHFADETAHATLALTMNDNQQVTWNLELPPS